MVSKIVSCLICLFLVSCFLEFPVFAADWPQLQNGPQRTGRSTETIISSVNGSWGVGFATDFVPARERLFPQTQPVIAGGKVFIGTEMGTMYALNATTGAKSWSYKTNGPIVGTAGVENNKVYFGCMDGNVYALNVADGSLAWKYNAGINKGFSQSVLLADNRVYIASRNGTYYALNQADGSVAWQRNMGTNILMSAAYNNGKIYFGGMNMKVYAISATDGSTVWQSNTIPGAAFKDYWPVVHNGYVFIRQFRVEGGNVVASSGDQTTWSMFAFSENSTSPAAAVYMPHAIGITMNGSTCPPSVDGSNYLIMPWDSDWKRLDTTNKSVVSTWSRPGTVNPDENVCSSTAGNYAILMHSMEQNAQFTGLWNVVSNSTTGLGALHEDSACGSGAIGCFLNNTQSGGTSPAAVANGWIYHNTQNTLNARKLQ